MALNFLIVGLGNPGSEYEKTRHNVGFMAADLLWGRYGTASWQKKFKGLVAPVKINGIAGAILKPQTFMNLSGESVAAAANFHKIGPERIFVLHDDLDLVLGSLKVKQGGGSAGHNGLKSIDTHVGNETWRLRIGIGHPGDRDRVTGHVLGPFSKGETQQIVPLLDRIGDSFSLLLEKKASLFLQEIKKAVE